MPESSTVTQLRTVEISRRLLSGIPSDNYVCLKLPFSIYIPDLLTPRRHKGPNVSLHRGGQYYGHNALTDEGNALCDWLLENRHCTAIESQDGHIMLIQLHQPWRQSTHQQWQQLIDAIKGKLIDLYGPLAFMNTEPRLTTP